MEFAPAVPGNGTPTSLRSVTLPAGIYQVSSIGDLSGSVDTIASGSAWCWLSDTSNDQPIGRGYEWPHPQLFRQAAVHGQTWVLAEIAVGGLIALPSSTNVALVCRQDSGQTAYPNAEVMFLQVADYHDAP